MPRTTIRTCAQPGCPQLTHGTTRCPTHQPAPWHGSTHNQNRRGTGWTEQRDAQRVLRAAHYQCATCGQPATEVDHVVPYSQGGLDTPANKQALCRSCHARKTAREAQAGRHPPGT